MSDDAAFRTRWLRTRKPYLDANVGKCLEPCHGDGKFWFCGKPVVDGGEVCAEHTTVLAGIPARNTAATDRGGRA